MVVALKVPKALDRNFNPGFKIDLHIKDLNNAMETAHEVGVPLLLTTQVREIMQALKVDGKQNDDHCSVIQFYEKLSGIYVRNI